MNKQFGYENEDKDYELLEDFNKLLKLSQLGRCPKNHSTDASGFTRDCKIANIELKRRNMNFINTNQLSGATYTADTLYIEAHKCGDMLLDYVCEGKIPLYINFLNNGYVILYNLSTLKNRPKKCLKKIFSKLYDGFEIAKREELPLTDAYIYEKQENNWKLIQKPKWEMERRNTTIA